MRFRVCVAATLSIATIAMCSSCGSGAASSERDDASVQLKGGELLADEVEANKCFGKHGVRISRENGVFELRGDINAGQDAYFDPTCNDQISPEVQGRVQAFFEGLDAQVVDCLRKKGFAVEEDSRGGFSAPDAPPADLRACIRAVYANYS